jgi:transposase
VWAPRGSRPTQLKQTEYEWVYLFGAANPRTGDSVAMVAPTVNTYLMNQHLRMIGEHVGPNIHVVLVLDNAGWHVAKALAVPENITLLPLPAYSPELNPLERLWCWLKEHQLSNRVYVDYDTLFQAGLDAWNTLTPERITTVCRTSWIKREN